MVATTVALMGSPEGDLDPAPNVENSERRACLYCGRNHALDECKQFKRNGLKEKMRILGGFALHVYVLGI